MSHRPWGIVCLFFVFTSLRIRSYHPNCLEKSRFSASKVFFAEYRSTRVTYYLVILALFLNSCGSGIGGGSSSFVEIVDNTPAPTSLSYARSRYTLVSGEVMNPIAPIYSGEPANFSVSPSLPTGIDIDTQTGVISGTPLPGGESIVPTSYTVTVSNLKGSLSFNLDIRKLNGYVVNSTLDTSDFANDGLCDDGAGNCSLRAAVEQANLSPGTQAILVPSGTYNTTSVILIDSLMVIYGENDGTATTIDGNGNPIFEVSNPIAGAQFEFLSLRAGNPIFKFSNTGNFFMNNLELQDSSSSGESAAIEITQGLDLSIVSSLFSNLTAASTGGAAIRIGNAAANVNLDTCSFKGNSTTTSGGGGAIRNDGTLSIQNSFFQNNISAASGGAIFNTSSLTIEETEFYNNQSAAGSSGGALYCAGTSCYVTTSTFVNNTAPEGAGINANCGVGTCIIDRSYFAGNNASLNGGAILAVSDLNATNNLFYANSAVNGSAIYDDGFNVALFYNSFVQNNTSTGGAVEAQGGSANIDLEGNLMVSQIGDDCALGGGGFILNTGDNVFTSPATACSPIGSDATSATVNFESGLIPVDNGGPTLSFRLAPGSDGVDHRTSGSNCPSQDQLGNPRFLGLECDAGSVESH